MKNIDWASTRWHFCHVYMYMWGLESAVTEVTLVIDYIKKVYIFASTFEYGINIIAIETTYIISMPHVFILNFKKNHSDRLMLVNLFRCRHSVWHLSECTQRFIWQVCSRRAFNPIHLHSINNTIPSTQLWHHTEAYKSPAVYYSFEIPGKFEWL